MQHLKIALLQADIIWQNALENRKRFTEKINSIVEPIDLIVFPEMFSTGFSMQPKDIAETMEGETVKWMKSLAYKKNAAICGSLIISEEKQFYNRFLFVHPLGEVEFYNKRHLFTLAGEDKVYKTGTEKKIINYKGWKICPQVCYDLRFPVFSRNVENYDLLIFVANWPTPRINAWDTLLKARSIENMSYTIGVNRIGEDPNGLAYNGHSATYNCLGEKVTKTDLNKELIEIVTLEKNHISETRNQLNFLNDMDNFTILG